MGARLHTVTLTGFKGGVGRTTGAAALAHGLAAIGHSVALIDAGHAVPLQEEVLSKNRGRGSSPDETLLQRWATRLASGCQSGSQVQYIRTSTAAYLESVLGQLRREAWHFAVVDTPAHQTPSVFQAMGQSSLLLVPARDAADACAVSRDLPEEFLDGYHTLRCLVAGSSNPSSVRQAFAPLPVLKTELPYQPDLCASVISSSTPAAAPISNEEWHTGCLSLAREAVELVERRNECSTRPNLGLMAT
ncbi:cellulose synthase operon protein YhjQ/BcsQ [Roseobacter denitrificans]|uniref:nucleotide-binding protein n=1 Tax=Roseobacter denitrificans TaxID=2434 RepID=UPI0008E0BFA2|nr:CobQ/CobB/MinD/ParA nucleotide binding domain-containing protein [Roseobacter denitrificans OCh 114]